MVIKARPIVSSGATTVNGGRAVVLGVVTRQRSREREAVITERPRLTGILVGGNVRAHHIGPIDNQSFHVRLGSLCVSRVYINDFRTT